MSVGFSSSLLLADLDYIAPAQACILPNVQQQQKLAPGQEDGAVTIHQKANIKDLAPKEMLEKVHITLADCLACSGCVTSAETILITNQSREEVERIAQLKLQSRENNNNNNNNNNQYPFLVSVSEQTISAASVEWKTSYETALAKINQFAVEVFHADRVISLDWAQAISSLETGMEFIRRFSNSLSTASCNNNNPLIVSACPGWVCYCEKTHPLLLPFLCPIMSPQAIAGKYWKQIHHPSSNSNNDTSSSPKPIHISIQPCFDRKLEAVRPEFSKKQLAQQAPPQPLTPEEEEAMKNEFDSYSDCVLSTKELLDWIKEWETKTEEEENSNDPENDSNSIKTISNNTATPSLSAASSAMLQSDVLKKFNLLHSSAAAASSLLVNNNLPQRRQNSEGRADCNNDNNNISEGETALKKDSNGSNFEFQRSCVSGAYHLVAMACLARERGIRDFDLSQVQYSERRGNKNFRIATHPQLLKNTTENESGGSGELLQFALVYGFQHIQNVVRAYEQKEKAAENSNKNSSSSRVTTRLAGRRLARNKTAAVGDNTTTTVDSSTDFCFIEMMACPGGCTNGGGQLMTKSLDPEAQRMRLQQIDEVFAENFWKQRRKNNNTNTNNSASMIPDSFYLESKTEPGTEKVAKDFLSVHFKDRRKEMEEKMENGNLVSLKW